MSILLFLLAMFALTAFTGFRYYLARVWDWIDVVYFPLSAVAIALFFASNDVQRQFLDVRQTLLTKRIGTNHAEAERLGMPKLRAVLGEDLKSIRFGSIREIGQFARACGPLSGPDSGSNFTRVPLPGSGESCRAAQRYLPQLEDFEEQIRRENRTRRYHQAEKLYTDCKSADEMIEGIRYGGRVSRSVGADMASIYKTFREKSVDPARFEEGFLSAIRTHVYTHKNTPEAQISGRILAGLLPCVVLTPQDFEALRNVLHKDSLFEVRLGRIDYLQAAWQKKRDRVAADPMLAWLRLSLWPYLLALAVSLKLGRVIASLRRDRLL